MCFSAAASLIAGTALSGFGVVALTKTQARSEIPFAMIPLLFGIGIPENSVIQYETHIKAGKFVVIAHGSADEVSKIRGVLDGTRHQGLTEHPMSENL